MDSVTNNLGMGGFLMIFVAIGSWVLVHRWVLVKGNPIQSGAAQTLKRICQYMYEPCCQDHTRMHDGGEVDVRACYTAISVASILNVLDYELIRNVGDYILSCQTHEGGISGEPGSEAHGGYTYCGVAAMILIDEVDRLDLPGLLDWVVFRQGVECGFQGRANKLVDGCYSFWQERNHLFTREKLK